MYLTKEKKQELFKEFGRNAEDTGSPESQVALFTFRINHLTGLLKKNKKDFRTKRTIQILVGKRKRLLGYLQKIDIERYRSLIKALGLRK